ncbi:MAG: hypothetical protein H7096_05030 [Flavobacterium sp.]|nr:hypothetical protein [Pedobacter sp.]
MELNTEILETTAKIQENYPELTKFADVMTIPVTEAPEINTKSLKEYNDSLQAMATGYANSSKKYIVARVGL